MSQFEDGEKEGPTTFSATPAPKEAATDVRVPEGKAGEKEITWEELAKHNKVDDAWVGLHGGVYDVTKWADEHPGGPEIIELIRGREVTHLFESYHKLSSAALIGSKKVPRVGKLISTEFPLYSGDSKFYTSLRQKAEKYFKDNNVKNVRKVTPGVLANTVFILSGMALCYYLAGFVAGFSLLTRVLISIAAGVFHHLSMVHLWHDMSHYSYGTSSTFWHQASWIGCIWVGMSMDSWRHRHILGHHVYTNVCGIDPDLGIYMAAPTKPMKQYKKKWEALGNNVILMPSWTQPILYLFIVLQMQLDDWRSTMQESMEAFKFNVNYPYIFAIPCILYYIQRLILPWYFGVLSIPTTILLFLVTDAVAGTMFGYFSQITHISTEVEWPVGTPIPRDWAELQVLTARDYAQDSWFWTYISGYLNYQVMHHLFPGIAPYHYPPLLPILKETCKEHNIPYEVLPSFWAAVKDHWKHLQQFQSFRKERLEARKMRKEN